MNHHHHRAEGYAKMTIAVAKLLTDEAYIAHVLNRSNGQQK
jgi:hypothetical protein